MTPYQRALHTSRGVQDLDGFHARLKADPVLGERLGYAHDHGIPPSILVGRTWPNPLDPTEPQWLEGDWSDVLTYRIWSRGRCPQCGIHERDWGSDSADTEQPYIARARLCHGCAEVEDAFEEHREHEHPRALRFALVPNETVEVI